MISDPFFPSDSLKTLGARAALRQRDPGLLEAICGANAGLPPSPERERNIALLGKPGSAAVLTGQQLGAFGGALFTLYKVISLLECSQKIARESGVPIVPVFWLQSEDHDFSEIESVNILSPEIESFRVTLPSEPAGERVSVGSRVLGSEVGAQIAQIEKTLGRYEHSERILSLLSECYHPGASLTSAFTRFIASLFPEDGIVFLDPRRLGALARPLFETALVKEKEITEKLLERNDELKNTGLESQVYVKSDSPLFFVHDSSGNRDRLIHTGGRYQGGHQSYSRTELEQILDSSPGRFSTSALLRPLLQDLLLPTVCYVAGEAELRYHRQSQALYDLFGVPRPLVTTRARFLLVEPAAAKLLAELCLKPEDLRLGEDALAEKLLSGNGSGELSPAALGAAARAKFQAGLSLLEESTKTLDQTLLTPLRKTGESINHALERFLERYKKAALNRDAVKTGRLTRLRTFLAPEGEIQERYYSPLSFLCKYGADFINRVRRETEVLPAREKEIWL